MPAFHIYNVQKKKFNVPNHDLMVAQKTYLKIYFDNQMVVFIFDNHLVVL